MHPDVAVRPQVRLIRDEKEGAAEDEEKWARMEGWLKRYQDQVQTTSRSGGGGGFKFGGVSSVVPG